MLGGGGADAGKAVDASPAKPVAGALKGQDIGVVDDPVDADADVSVIVPMIPIIKSRDRRGDQLQRAQVLPGGLGAAAGGEFERLDGLVRRECGLPDAEADAASPSAEESARRPTHGHTDCHKDAALAVGVNGRR